MAERVGEVARLFLRLGVTGFGGRSAHVALMEDECVRVRRWVTREEFADMLGAANVLPGPRSTELAMMLGLRPAGWIGLVMTWVGFIAPAVVIVWMFAWWYGQAGRRPDEAAVLVGMQPVVVALVMQAVWRLGRSVVTGWMSGLIVVTSFVALLVGVHELIVLVLASAIAMGVREGAHVRERAALVAAAGLSAPAGVAALAVSGATVGGVFASFLKIGCVVFGSGYVLLAFMRAEFVERHGWLTEAQPLDAIAIGQVTPGPVFSTATFVGSLLAGHAGAATASVGVFLPAFVFAAVSGVIVTRVRRSARAGAALDGVNAASLALMAVAVVLLSRGVVSTPYGAAVAVTAFGVLMATRIGAAWLLLVGAAVGLLRGMV